MIKNETLNCLRIKIWENYILTFLWVIESFTIEKWVKKKENPSHLIGFLFSILY